MRRIVVTVGAVLALTVTVAAAVNHPKNGTAAYPGGSPGNPTCIGCAAQ